MKNWLMPILMATAGGIQKCYRVELTIKIEPKENKQAGVDIHGHNYFQ